MLDRCIREEQGSSKLIGKVRMMTDTLFPSEIMVSSDRTTMTVAWSNGQEGRYRAWQLRKACRSSNSLRDAIDGKASKKSMETRIADVRPVGNYAVNIVFSDGHDRGIFPWSYLRGLEAERV